MDTYYVRARGSATWHWLRQCSRFPRTLNIEATRRDRPAEGLCEECRSREFVQERTTSGGREPHSSR